MVRNTDNGVEVIGTEEGRWSTNGPDAGILARAFHEGRLKEEHTGPEICSRYRALEAKWGTRRLRDNFRKIVKNYRLWDARKSRKYTMRFFLFLCEKILTNSKDYFSPAFLLENGLLKPPSGEGGEEDAFAGDEEVWNANRNNGNDGDDGDDEEEDDEDYEEEKEAESPPRANTVPINKPAKNKAGKKKASVINLFETLRITVDDNEEMKIRMVAHTVRVTPFDEITYLQGSRICVYVELPSGVSPRSVTAAQGGGKDSNEIEITIERNKNLFDPNFFIDCLLKTGDRNIDDGIVNAAEHHCEKEKEGLELGKRGVVKTAYKFVVPPLFHVESGFRCRKDPTRVDNKAFISFQSVDLEDKHKNIDTCNFVFFFLLGWTPDQAEKKKAVKLLGGGQSRRGGKKVIFSPKKSYGDYDSGPSGENDMSDVEPEVPSPEPAPKRGRVSPSVDESSKKGF
jgi:hypothetical protein